MVGSFVAWVVAAPPTVLRGSRGAIAFTARTPRTGLLAPALARHFAECPLELPRAALEHLEQRRVELPRRRLAHQLHRRLVRQGRLVTPPAAQGVVDVGDGHDP